MIVMKHTLYSYIEITCIPFLLIQMVALPALPNKLKKAIILKTFQLQQEKDIPSIDGIMILKTNQSKAT